ncbi:MAG: leucyl aminopeptidase [bacterium]
MKFEYVIGADPASLTTPSLVVLTPELKQAAADILRKVDDACRGALTQMITSGEFSGKEVEMVRLFPSDAFACRQIVVAGLGAAAKVDADSYRRAAGCLSRFKPVTSQDSLVLWLENGEDVAAAQAIVEGFLLGGFRLLEFKGEADDKEASGPNSVTLALKTRRYLGRVQKAAALGQVAAEGQLLARRLAATPANFLTPSEMARRAQSLARENGIDVRVLDIKGIEKANMGALLSVARGSEEPPRFVILQYNGGRAKQKPVVLVGKGITFDSGGLSLKAADLMPEMKGDMTGAAIVLATIVAAAKLKLKQNLVGLVPLAENMPSAHATRPGDIITSRKGLTIEILNTDAEGRLILADALDYANEFDPQAVIDIATLTGGALYVLGYSGAPILGNHAGLMDRLRAASAATAERVWEMPIWDDFRDAMKSDIADLANSGGRPAATMTAAAFLENFIGDWPWAHIDIAYVDVEPKGRPYTPKGQTGIGMRLLLQLVVDWKKL